MLPTRAPAARSWDGETTRRSACDIRSFHDDTPKSRLSTRGGFASAISAAGGGTVVNGAVIRGATATVDLGGVIHVGPYALTVGGDGAGLTPVSRSAPACRASLNAEVRQLYVDGRLTVERLSELEFRLVSALLSGQPSVVPNQVIGDSIWGEGRWDTYMLHNLVRRVRRKLEAGGYAGDELIVTVTGVGYRLV